MLAARYPAEVALVSDAALAAEALSAALAGASRPREKAMALARRLSEENVAVRSPLERLHDRILAPVRAVLADDALVYADMTQIAYTGCITWPARLPATWHFPVGFGTLGYALPAAIGGKIACPRRQVVALAGDGGFQFTVQELATAVELALPLPILLWDNDALAEIADFMTARQIPQTGVYPRNPDFAALAAAYGAGYVAADRPEAIGDALVRAFGQPRPTLIHLRQQVLEHG